MIIFYFIHYLTQKDLLKTTIILNISNLPNSIQKVVNNLVKGVKELQSPVGPMTPSPGPIFPIDDAAIDIDDTKSIPLADTNNAHRENIKI